MEKELLNTFNKELLLKDLCGRLPYDTVCQVEFKSDGKYESKNMILSGIFKDEAYFTIENGSVYSNDYKPYLFPLSSMTDKDLIEFLQIKGMNLNSDELKTFKRGTTAIVSTLPSYSRHIDWLNKNHFDYRNLIDKNLAIDCTNLNIY